MIRTPWTAKDDVILREMYVRDGAKATAAALGRPIHCVHIHARRTGVKARPQWSAKDREALRMGWGEVSIAELAAKLGRSRRSTFDRGVRMGLKAGCPAHREYVQAAADRTGFHLTTMRRILKWARIVPVPAPTYPAKRPTIRTTVDPYAVDEAVKAWLQTETLAAAGRARDISPHRIWIALGRLPKPPKRRRHRRHWRLSPEVIDAALAERRRAA